jgi:hypothetical protein
MEIAMEYDGQRYKQLLVSTFIKMNGQDVLVELIAWEGGLIDVIYYDADSEEMIMGLQCWSIWTAREHIAMHNDKSYGRWCKN